MTARPELKTDRLRLRRWLPADRAPFAALNADPRVTEYLPGPLSPEESDALVARLDAHFTPCVEIGWRLGTEHWGHGYATEGARAVLGFGFEVLGLEEIVSFTVPHNVRSRRVMERIGMTHNAADEFAHPLLPDGHPLRRHVLYRIARREAA